MRVFVLNKNKKPLDPCHPAKARKLLKQGKAVIHKKYPFTIRLKYKVDKPSSSDYRLKIDYGSQTTGLAILKNDKEVIWLADLNHKVGIKKRMDKRRQHRRNRRCRKIRYRESRFNNRRRKKGWLPPTVQSRVDNIETWTKRLLKLVPLTAISYENVKFDTQKMRNPEIEGVEYQHGTLQGYNIKQYLLEKFDYKCVYCGKSGVTLEVEHVIPVARGGTDRIDNLTIACVDCNSVKGNQTAAEFGYPEVQKQAKQTLRHASIVNSSRWAVYKVLNGFDNLNLECGTGARTKMQRIRHDLPKTHYYDAVCIGKSTPEDYVVFKTEKILHIQAKGRGSRQIACLNKHGFPWRYNSKQKLYYGFQTGDIVKAVVSKGKYEGIWNGVVATRKSGYFDIKDIEGKRQASGINHKYIEPIQRFDGYTYKIKERRYD